MTKSKKKESEPEYIRKGKCKQCGMCCLFKDGMQGTKLNSNDHKFMKEIGYTEVMRKKIKPKKGKPWTQVIMGKIQGCPHLIMKAGKLSCRLHGTKKQPEVCRVFPCHPSQDYYKVFKKTCGYRFIKNPKYKPLKKKQEAAVESKNLN